MTPANHRASVLKAFLSLILENREGKRNREGRLSLGRRWSDRILIKLQLTGKSRLIFKFQHSTVPPSCNLRLKLSDENITSKEKGPI